MKNFIQPESSSFPLDKDKYVEVSLTSSIEELEKDIKDAICCHVSNDDNWNIVINKVIEK